jgi:hypothetical protein
MPGGKRTKDTGKASKKDAEPKKEEAAAEAEAIVNGALENAKTGADKKLLESLMTKLSLKDMPKVHKFWKTQPVPQTGTCHVRNGAVDATTDVCPTAEWTERSEDGPVEANPKAEDICKTALPLPSTFEWSDIDLDSTEQVEGCLTCQVGVQDG